MALNDKVVSSIKARFADLNPSIVHYPDILYNYFWFFTILLMIVDVVLGIVNIVLCSIGKAGFPSSVYLPWLIVNIICFYSVSIVETRVSISQKDDRWKSDAPLYLHFAYVFCILISFFVLPDETSENRKTSAVVQDLRAAYICLWLLEIVEIMAIILYVSDSSFAKSLSEKEKVEWDPAGRWWIRTVPYAILGMIFLVIYVSAILFGIGGAGYSMFYSVAVSVMAVNYLAQIINERIVPKEGPYRKTHMAVYMFPAYNGPVCRPFSWNAHARRPKPSSPSTGRGEGAC